MKTTGNPTRSGFVMHLSIRCRARTRSGSPCCGPAMPNGRCRLHGGSSPGAPKGKANGMYRHGLYTAEAIAQRHELITWIKTMRQLVEGVA